MIKRSISKMAKGQQMSWYWSRVNKATINIHPGSGIVTLPYESVELMAPGLQTKIFMKAGVRVMLIKIPEAVLDGC